MNYVKMAEDRLRYYRDMQRSIKNAESEIARLVRKAGPNELNAIQLDITGIRCSKQDEAIDTLMKIMELKDCAEKTEEALKDIDFHLEEVSLGQGCELFGQVLRRWYIDEEPKEKIAEDLRYSERKSIYQIRERAIRKFAIQLFGIKALNGFDVV